MFNEFKNFIARGNVMDMAVGIIVGAAFTGIVQSLVKDIFNPLLGVFTGGIDFSNLYVNLSGQEFDSLAAAQEAGAATINYGMFINAIINFLIIAFAVFIMIKGVNRVKEAAENAPKDPATPTPPKDIVLLTEIRDLLKK